MPWIWEISRDGEASAFRRAVRGYRSAEDAWEAGRVALARLERQGSRWRNGPAAGWAAAVVVPQTDGVTNGVGPWGPAPSIIEGRPWSTMPGSMSHWN